MKDRINFRAAYWLLACCLLFAGCQSDDKNEIKPADNPDRTILIYMAGDNSLSSWASDNISKIMNTYDGRGNLLVYVDTLYEAPRLVRLTVGEDGICRREVVRTYEEQNSASPAVMKEVIEGVCRDFPASSYGLILWSHGTAWLPSGPRLLAFGQDGSDWMELPDLGKALPDNRFDFILFDACYMGSVEVAYELRNKTKYLISSPMEVWVDGFPYGGMVDYLWGGEDGYRKVCEAYINYYRSMNGVKRSGTISLVRMEGMDELTKAVADIVMNKEDQISSLDRTDIQRLDRTGSLYWNNILYDLDGYMAHLSPATPQYENFRQKLEKVVAYEAHTDSFAPGDFSEVKIRKCCGLTCYIPETVRYPGLTAFYSRLNWALAVY